MHSLEFLQRLVYMSGEKDGLSMRTDQPPFSLIRPKWVFPFANAVGERQVQYNHVDSLVAGYRTTRNRLISTKIRGKKDYTIIFSTIPLGSVSF